MCEEFYHCESCGEKMSPTAFEMAPDGLCANCEHTVHPVMKHFPHQCSICGSEYGIMGKIVPEQSTYTTPVYDRTHGECPACWREYH